MHNWSSSVISELGMPHDLNPTTVQPSRPVSLLRNVLTKVAKDDRLMLTDDQRNRLQSDSVQEVPGV